jgi:hypothetical protein
LQRDRDGVGVKRFVLRAIWYDPYQMQASAQRLAKAGMPIEEYPRPSPT